MKKAKYLLFLTVVSLLSISCEKQSINPVVDPLLQPYLSSFVAEGELRGKSIQLSDFQLSAQITNISSQFVAGQCAQNNDNVVSIIIDQQIWRRYTDLEKEILMFHELGHCLLKRTHVDDRDEFGNCVSLMESGRGLCREYYNDETRDKYLNELFL